MKNSSSKNRVSGWLLVNKPEHKSSAACSNKIKYNWQLKKIGFAGTLDPLASGVLPMALGDATKTLPYMMEFDKEYIFAVEWGVATVTDDREGEICGRSSYVPTPAEVEAILPEFIGEIMQTPPVYSAVKIGGKRACDRARDGEMVTVHPKLVRITELELLASNNRLRVVCSSGTYVRSLARDLALRLNTYAHVTELQRTRVGAFTLTQTIDFVRLAEAPRSLTWLQPHLLPVDACLDHLPLLEVNEAEAVSLRQGQVLALVNLAAPPLPIVITAPTVRIYKQGKCIGLAMIQQRELAPVRMFGEESQ